MRSPSKKIQIVRSAFLFLFLVSVFVGITACAELEKGATNRPSTWAVKIDKAGLQNLHSLSTNIYRGAQPSAAGMASLQAMGIKTVINLRGFHSDKTKIGKLELASEHLRFNTWHAEDEDVISFLKIVTDTNRWPVFIHCQHGSDRTGLMSAMYRMTVDNWTREEAIREMTEGGYGFHPEWQNLIHYLRKVDVEKIKRGVGIDRFPAKATQVPPQK